MKFKLYIEDQLFFISLCFGLLFKQKNWSSRHYEVFRWHLGNNISKRKWNVIDWIIKYRFN